MTAVVLAAGLVAGLSPTTTLASQRAGAGTGGHGLSAIPQQSSGTAAGKSHKASTDQTRKASTHVGTAVGVKAKKGKGELPPYQAPGKAVKPGPSGLGPKAADTAKPYSPRDGVAAPDAKPVTRFDAAKSVEDPAKRDARSNTYKNPDGTFTMKVSTDRVNFRRQDGTWAPIDETLVPDGAVAGPADGPAARRWTQKAESQRVSFASRSDDKALMTISASGISIGFGLSGAADVQGTPSAASISYPRALPASDLTLSATTSGVGQSMVLRSSAAPTVWEFPMTLSGVRASVDANRAVDFTDSVGTVVATVPGGILEDSRIDPATGLGQTSNTVTYQIVTAGGVPTLRVVLDSAWLHDPKRVFPVTVDTSTVLAQSSSSVQPSAYETAAFNGTAHPTFQYDGFDGEMGVGSPTGGAGAANASMLIFPNSQLPANAWVRAADVFVYSSWAEDCSATDVFAMPITANWPSTNANVGYPGVQHGGVAGKGAAAGGANCSGGGRWADISMYPGSGTIPSVNAWTHYYGSNYGLLLVADNTDAGSYKRFRSHNGSVQTPPYMNLTYTPYSAGYSYPTGAATFTTSPHPDQGGQLDVTVSNIGMWDWTTAFSLGAHIYSDPGSDRAQVWSGRVGTLSSVLKAYQHPTAAQTVHATLPAVPIGSYDVCWDMLYSDGKTFMSSDGAPMSCIRFDVEPAGPAITWLSPADGYTEGTLTPTLTAYWTEGDGVYPPGSPTFFWTVCPVVNGQVGCPAGSAPAQTSDPYFTVGGVTGPGTPLAWNQSYAWSVVVRDGAGARSAPTAWSYIGTEVPQPVITSHLGGDAYNGSGKSLDPEIGNFVEPVTDASVTTMGPALELIRTYNSLDPRTGLAFGAGWSSLLDTAVVPDNDGSGNVVVAYPDGTQARFGHNADGTFTSPLGRHATLVVISGGYRLTDTDGKVYTFTRSVANGSALTSIADVAGRTESFAWTDAAHLTITAANGRHLFVVYSTPAGAKSAHVAQVSTDPTAAGGTALVWTYSYSADTLTGYCAPTSATACYAYGSAATGSHYRSAVMDANPRGYWRMGDSDPTQNAYDDAAANQGSEYTVYGPGVALGQAGPLAGGATAAAFDGTSSYFYTSVNPVQGNTDIAVELWFKTTSAAGGALYATGHSLPNTPNPDSRAMPVLYVGTDGKLHGHFWDGTVAGMASPGTVADGAWHHVLLSAAGATQTLSLDGVQVGTETGQITNVDPVISAGAGVFNTSAWPAKPADQWGHFNGDIAELAVYDHPVGAPQLAQQYNAAAASAPLLTKITTPMGRVRAALTYDTVGDRVSRLADANGGSWTLSSPHNTSAAGISSTLAASPVAFWPLRDNGVGPAVNRLNSGNGVYVDVTQTNGSAPFMDGSSTSVSLPDGIVPTDGPWAAQIWFQADGPGALMAQQAGSLDNPNAASQAHTPFLYVGADGKLVACMGNANGCGSAMTSAGTVIDNNWHQAVVTTDETGANQRLYLDGQLVAEKAGRVASSGQNKAQLGAGLFAGGWPDAPANPAGHFTGFLSSASVYRHALDAPTVAGQYKTGVPGAPSQIGVTEVDPGGNTLTFVYDPNMEGRILSKTDGMGGVTTYGYDVGGYLDTVTDPNGNIVTTGHDANGNPVSTTTCKDLFGGDCFTSYADYTVISGKNVEPDALDARSSGPADTTYATHTTFNTTGPAIAEPASVTTPQTADNPAGQTTTYTYTTGSEPAVCPIGPGCSGTQPAGLIAKSTGPGTTPQVTLFAYDAYGDLTSKTDPTGQVTTYGYDGIGRQIAVRQATAVFPAGLETDTVLDGDGRPTQVTGPPTTDRVTGVVHQLRTATVYDADGKTTSSTVSDAKGGDQSRTTTYTYDPFGRVHAKTDPTGAVTTTGWDGYGNRVVAIDADNVETDYSYNPNGQLINTELRNFTGDPTAPQAAADLDLESRAYDPAGRLASVTDAMGRETVYVYYDDNRLYETALANFHDPDGTTRRVSEEQNWYDPAGDVYQRVTGNQTLETDYCYDAERHLIWQRTDPGGAGHVNRIETFAYDADGNLLTDAVNGPGSPALPQAGAPAYVGRLGSVNPSPATTNSTVVPVTAAGKSGDALVLSMMLTNAAAGPVTATDSQGNTYTPTGIDQSDGADDRTIVLVALGAKALGTSDTIRLTFPGSGAGEVQAAVDEFSGITGIDTSKSNTGPAGATFDSTATSGTAQPSELIFGVAGVQGGDPATFGTGYTALPTVFVPGGDDQLATAYQTVNAVGAYNASGTADHVWMAGVLALKGTTAGGLGTGPMRPTTVTETTTYGYTAGQETSQTITTSAGSAKTTSTYDTQGKLLATTDPRGNAPNANAAAYTTSYGYDELGRTVSITTPAVNAETNGGPATTVQPATITGYDTFGEAVESKNASGAITTTSYDADGHPLGLTLPSYTPPGATTPVTSAFSVAYDPAGHIKARTDALKEVTSYTLDQLGRPVAQTDPAINGNTAGGVTHTSYDNDGEVLAGTDQTGAQTRMTYDDFGRTLTSTLVVRQPESAARTTSFGYDDAGNQLWVKTPAGEQNTMTYDATGNMLSVLDPAGGTTTYVHDVEGRTTQTTDPAGRSTVAAFDPAGRQIAAANLDPAGNVIRAETAGYDLVGNRVSSTDAQNNATTTFAYDASNHLVRQVEPVSSGKTITTTFGYDAAGHQTRMTDGNGDSTITTYTSHGKPESVIEPATQAYPNAADRTYTTIYDANGKVKSTLEPGGVTVADSYDAMGNLIRQSGSGAEAATVDRVFGYDLAGRITSASAPGGTDAITYDDHGLPLTVTGPSGNSSFAYDANGRMTQRTDASGTTTYRYDAAGRLETLTDGVTATAESFGYYADSRPKTITYGAGGDVRTFGYDALGRVSSDALTTAGGAAVAGIGYGYTLDDQLVSKTTTGFAGAGANTYGYDLAGRLTSWTSTPAGGAASTTAYAYDNAGNRTQIGGRTLTYDARDRLTNDGDAAYTYTARGTTSSRTPNGGSAQSVTSDAFDQTASDGGTLYTYDAFGRVAQRGATAFAYSGVGNTIASDGTNTYSRDPSGQLVATAQGAAKTLAWTDQHGDVVAGFAPGAAALAGSTSFDPLGNQAAASGAGSSLGFQGGYTDPATGKVNMAARWYDPANGRFTGRDSIATGASPSSANANRFGYAAGDPLDATDPTGHFMQTVNFPGTSIGAFKMATMTEAEWKAAFDAIVRPLEVGEGEIAVAALVCRFKVEECEAPIGATIMGTITSTLANLAFTVDLLNLDATKDPFDVGSDIDIGGATWTEPITVPICGALVTCTPPPCGVALPGAACTPVPQPRVGTEIPENPPVTVPPIVPKLPEGPKVKPTGKGNPGIDLHLHPGGSATTIIDNSTGTSTTPYDNSRHTDPTDPYRVPRTVTQTNNGKDQDNQPKVDANQNGCQSLADNFVYYFPRDNLRRATGAVACLNKGKYGYTGRKNPYTPDPPSEIMGSDTRRGTNAVDPTGFVSGMARGHLIGRILGGDGTDPRNLVPMYRDPNSVVMKNYEQTVYNAVQTQTVFYAVVPWYDGDSLIPEELSLHAVGTAGNVVLDATVYNVPS